MGGAPTLPLIGPSCAYAGYHDHLSGPAAASVTFRFLVDAWTSPKTSATLRCLTAASSQACASASRLVSFRWPSPQCPNDAPAHVQLYKSRPTVFHGLFHDAPVGLHLAPLGPSTFLPGVPPPSSPGSLHLPPRSSSTFLPGVPPPSSPCPSMWTANCPVVLVVTCGNEPNRRL